MNDARTEPASELGLPDVHDYDPYADAVMRDPWPFYTALRRDAPVHYCERYDTWFLSRFDDILASTTRDIFTAERGVTPEMVLLKRPPPPAPVFSMLDMPRHREYRRMFSPRYGRRAVAALEPEIRSATRELLEPLVAEGHFDVYRELASPLATRVIADLLGLPLDLAMPLRTLVERHFRREPGQVGTSEANQKALDELMGQLAAFIAARREEPDSGGEDHLSVMLRTPAEGRPLPLEAIVAAAFTLLVTGIEVVTFAVANTIYYLGRHPDQRRMVVDDPSLVPHAFAESLRYDQPTNLLGRFVRERVELHGKVLEPGQGVMFLWASGNRDEREFERADVFDITRRPRRSLSYGHGIHKCIGEHLGNLEGRILVEEILAAAPDYTIEAAERVYSEFLHGFARVEIAFAPR